MFASSKSAKAAAAAAATDPYFPYVPLLLQTASTNGQQNNTFLDSSTNNFTITRNGAVTQGSSNPYRPGYWSGYFSGNYLSVADSASLRFGSGNFTIEAWVFRTESGATYTIACKGSSTGPTGWAFQISSANKLVFIDTSTSITGSTSLAANTWYYVAVVRAGTGAGQTTLYVNGASDGTGTSATTFSQTDAMRIGTDRGAANDFYGYVSNLRLSNTNLTISSTPTTPLTALGSTIFLSCGYNRFIDGSTLASAITVFANAVTVQAWTPFSPSASYPSAAYGGSGYFDGSTGYLNTASNSAFTFGTGDFTIECWFYYTGSIPTGTAQLTLFSNLVASDNATFDFQYFSTGFRIIAWSGGAFFSGTTAMPLGWNHVAVTRSGTTGNIWLNGVSIGTSSTFSNNFSTVAALKIGYNGYNNTWNGYISNSRVVKGTAVYTGSFTPPSLAPLTTSGATSAASYPSTTNVNTSFAASNTSILLNYTNAGIYDATMQNNMTTVGDAQASTTQYKWSPTSMKFDGTGDYLTIPDNVQLLLGTGDFTIEGWVYLSATGVNYGIIGRGTSSTGWLVNIYSNKLSFAYSNTSLDAATSLASGTWYYFAVVRSGTATGNLKIYLNGSVDATSSGAVTTNFNQTNVLYVGASRTAAQNLNGYLQDIRISKYARTITTPTAAFPTR